MSNKYKPIFSISHDGTIFGVRYAFKNVYFKSFKLIYKFINFKIFKAKLVPFCIQHNVKWFTSSNQIIDHEIYYTKNDINIIKYNNKFCIKLFNYIFAINITKTNFNTIKNINDNVKLE